MNKLSKRNVDLVLKKTDSIAGTPKILMRQAFSLTQDNFDVSVISETFHSDLISSHQVNCLKTFKWPWSSLNERKFFDYQAQRKIRKNSLVIGHGDSLSQDILFLHTCAHKGAEIAPGPHNNKNYSLPFHRMIFEKGFFKEIVCVTHMMKNDIQKRFNVQKPMHVIYPGHDKDINNKVDHNLVNSLRQSLKVQNDELVVGVVASGNLKNRGAFALLKAMSFLDQSHKEKIKLLIIGKEANPSQIYALAQEVGMKDKVVWMNPRLDVENLISAIDVVVYAAHIEASGLTFLECLALAKPVIATSSVGFTEILPEIQKDFIIEKQDPKAIANKLKLLLGSKELRLQMGQKNQLISKDYTWENYDKKFLELVYNHLAQFPSPLNNI